MKREQGFSLIEMLVVIAVMLVLVAAFAPAVVSSIQAGNEQATVNDLHQVINAEVAFSRLYPNVGYSPTGAALGGVNSTGGCPAIPLSTGACLIADSNAQKLDGTTGTLNGYTFTYVSPQSPPNQSWYMTAAPATAYAGRKSYCADSSGSVYYVAGTTPPTASVTGGCTSGTILGQ